MRAPSINLAALVTGMAIAAVFWFGAYAVVVAAAGRLAPAHRCAPAVAHADAPGLERAR